MTTPHQFKAVLAIAIVVAVAPATAQSYPTKPVRMIVPLTAGSGADVLARQIASRMTENWGQQVVVDNRPGAGGTIGAAIVARAPADGYTLLVHSAAFATSAAFYTKLAYDPVKNFTPISQIAQAPLVLVVAPALGPRNVGDLVSLASQKAGQITFGSSGVGTSTHFGGEQFNLAAKIKVVHVPYKGPAEALIDTATGRIQYFMAPLVPALPFISDGRLIALAVTTGARTKALPNIPTVAETGLPNYEYQDWWGMFAPGATPPSLVNTLSKEVAQILKRSDVVKQIANQGAEAKFSTADEFTRFVRSKIEAAANVVRLSGIRSD